jgi:peptidoglycan/LPS O-acetylase OafA/YrhL
VAAGLAVPAVLVVFADCMPRPLISAGIVSPAFAAIIFGLALQPRWVRALDARWLVLLGEASYSLYLLHSFVILLAFNLFTGLPAGLRVIFAVAAAIGAALLCFTLIERPARRRLRQRPREPLPGVQPEMRPGAMPET